MKPMRLTPLAEKFNALSLRERGIVAASMALMILLGSWQFVVEPALKKHKLLRQQLDRMVTDGRTLDTQRQELQRALDNDPNQRMREAIVQLQAQLAEVDAELGTLQGRLVSPSAMLTLLRQVLELAPEVQVVSLANLPAQAVALHTPTAPPADAAPAMSSSAEAPSAGTPPAEATKSSPAGPTPDVPEPLLFRHDAELVVQGSFHALLGYLRQLEALQTPLIWSVLEYKVLEYPTGELRLRVSTLGLYKEWLGG